MASLTSSGLLLWILAFLVLHSVSSAMLNCGNCLPGSSLVCPNYQERQFEVQVMHHSSGHVIMKIECADVDRVDFKQLLQGCSFPSVDYVQITFCPFPNRPFADLFAELGVQAANVKVLNVFYYPLLEEISLQSHHLRGLSNLTVLFLDTTRLQGVSEDAFRDTTRLKVLHMKGNNLGTLPKEVFQPLLNLTQLNLSNNNFSSLPTGLFDNLRNLQSMIFWMNNLVSLPPGIFRHLESLQNLTFHTNKLSSLDENLFAQTHQLLNVNFKRNKITRIPENLFINASLLQTVGFYDNQIKVLPDNLLSNKSALTKVDFGKNLLEALPQRLFHTTPSLTSIKVSKNRLKTLPPALFASTSELESLDLSNNLLENLPSDLFNSTIHLATINLGNNNLVDLPDNLFSKCRSLNELVLRDNKLVSLSINSFPDRSESSLEFVDFSGNNLTTEGVMPYNVFALNLQLGLRSIDFGNNRFTSFPGGTAFASFTSLEELNFTNNLIRAVSLFDVLSIPSSNVEVDLRNNRIEMITGNSMGSGKTVEVFLEGNSLACNCSLYQFVNYLQGADFSRRTVNQIMLSNGSVKTSSPQDLNRIIRVVDKDKLVCQSPEPLVGKELSSVGLESLTCLIPKEHCSSDCPCILRPYDTMVVVNCSGLGQTTVPDFKLIPGHDYTLDLSANRLSSFNLSSEKYHSIVNLTLEDNLLIASSLPNASVLPPRLTFLDLRRNSLTHLENDFVSGVNLTGVRVALEGNPWACDCRIKSLHDFVQDYYGKVQNVRRVVCASDGRSLMDLTEEDVCPVLLQPMVLTSIGVITALLVLFAVLGTVSFYRYKTRIKVWLFTHQRCLWLVTEDELDVDKQYDAFISYSHKDEAFVNNHLVPGLEKGEPPYRICLHYRDWVVGEFIQQQILDSVHNSRRTLIVLSSNFLESVWGQMEFRAAHQQAMQDKTNRVIVIVYGEMPPEDALDEELRHYVKLNTYLRWDDPRFWDSLRYAMPHPRHLLSKRRHKKRPKKWGLEKLELVNGNVAVVKGNGVVVAKDNAIPV